MQWKRENYVLQAFLWAMVRTGVYRLTIWGDLVSFGYPEAVAAELTALRSTNQAFDTYYAEAVLARRELTDSAAQAQALGALPLMILWATENPAMPASQRDRIAQLQSAVAGYSSNSAVRYVQGASHGSIIGNEQYAAQVTAAAMEVLAAQNGGMLTAPG
ncbi:MAG: hypothetical protein SF162_01915 [bacterium]|nr:hypothetical protein [bacterium]